jgi:hypothetical protein
MFSEHFRKVHMREDASQAAARIVREATGYIRTEIICHVTEE